MNNQAARIPSGLRRLVAVGSTPSVVVPRRCLAAAAQAQPRGDHASGSAFPLAEISTQTLKNGMFLGAAESSSPLATITVLTRAGARVEDENTLGASHCLRAAVGLSTRNVSSFLLTRNLQLAGCSLAGFSSREYFGATLTGLRDQVDRYMDLVIEAVLSPALKPWEIHDAAVPRMRLERALMEQNPAAALMEALHRAAYRGPLGNSVYAPAYKIGTHSSELLSAFLARSIVPGQVYLLGTGVEPRRLAKYLDLEITLPKGGGGAASGPPPQESRWLGTETLLDTPSPITHVALASEGAAAKNTKDRLALGLFATILGGGGRVPYSGGEASPLGQAAAKATKEPVAATSLNINYSDTGMFGFRVSCAASDARPVVKALVGTLRERAKGISDKDLQNAKNNLKAQLLLSTDGDIPLSSWMIEEVIGTGAVTSPAEMVRAIDSISLQDVTSVAGRVTKGRGALAAVGQLHNVPHLDELA